MKFAGSLYEVHVSSRKANTCPHVHSRLGTGLAGFDSGRSFFLAGKGTSCLDGFGRETFRVMTRFNRLGFVSLSDDNPPCPPYSISRFFLSWTRVCFDQAKEGEYRENTNRKSHGAAHGVFQMGFRFLLPKTDITRRGMVWGDSLRTGRCIDGHGTAFKENRADGQAV